jgi:hypothetical protein
MHIYRVIQNYLSGQAILLRFFIFFQANARLIQVRPLKSDIPWSDMSLVCLHTIYLLLFILQYHTGTLNKLPYSSCSMSSFYVSCAYFLVPVPKNCAATLTNYVTMAYLGVLVPYYIDHSWLWFQACHILDL